METIPHNIFFEILLKLSGADLLNFCSTNVTISSICDESNDYFWNKKVLNDYIDQNIPNKPGNISWKRFYILLGTSRRYIKKVPVTYQIADNIEQLGHIWINYTDTPNKILRLTNNLFINKYPNDHPDSLVLIMNNLEMDMFWINPISNPDQVTNFDEDYYNLVTELRYYTSSFFTLRQRVRAKEAQAQNFFQPIIQPVIQPIIQPALVNTGM